MHLAIKIIKQGLNHLSNLFFPKKQTREGGTINLIVPHMGKLPDSFNEWRNSVLRNKECLRIILITDQKVKKEDNLHVIKLNKKSLEKRVAKFIYKTNGCKINGINLTNDKLNDIKPLLPLIIESKEIPFEVKESDHIGYGSINTIYGNISLFYNNNPISEYNALSKYEVIGVHSEFTAVRKNSKILKIITKGEIFKRISHLLQLENYQNIDEGVFRYICMIFCGAIDYETLLLGKKHKWNKEKGWTNTQDYGNPNHQHYLRPDEVEKICNLSKALSTQDLQIKAESNSILSKEGKHILYIKT